MRHDSSIPYDLHVNARRELRESLGSFWNSVFSDQDLIDGILAADVLSASQLHIDAMEALSARDHRQAPVFHREHWSPIFIRLSQRNTGVGLLVGMEDTPQLGPQTEPDSVYLSEEVFIVGGNAFYSKVNTYPIVTADGDPLIRVKTGIFDSISHPTQTLVQNRDFKLKDGVLTVRKEKDPFAVGSYQIIESAADKVAVLWVCDGEFDRGNVSGFIGYPLGVDAVSDERSASMLSALWDSLINGVTPLYLNRVLGEVFDVPVAVHDESVESVTESGSFSVIVTPTSVYRVSTSRLSKRIVPGYGLKEGEFLTDEIAVYSGLSPLEFASKVDDGRIGNISLPPGSIANVRETVTLENRESVKEPGSWFKLSEMDSATSPFWSEVLRTTTQEERDSVFSALSGGRATVNPLTAIGYLVLANMVLVRTTRTPLPGICSGLVLDYLRGLIPASSSLLVIYETEEDSGSVSMEDEVSYVNGIIRDSAMEAPSDTVGFNFIPVDILEV